MDNTTPWYRQKTTWAGIGGMITAASGYFTGTLNPAEAIQLFFTSLVGVFLRQGIEKLKL